MYKSISISLFSALLTIFAQADTVLYRQFLFAEKKQQIKVISVSVGQEFEVPFNFIKDRLHDEWHLYPTDFIEQEIGVDLISESISRQHIEPYDDYWQEVHCNLIYKFKANKIGSYILTFKRQRVIACSSCHEPLFIRVNIS